MAPPELPLPPLERLSLGSSCRRCAPTGDRVPPGAEPGEEDRCALCYDVLTNIGSYQLPGEDLRPVAPTWVRICANHHAYHKVCIRWWLFQSTANRSCPECKEPVLRVHKLQKILDGDGIYTFADGTTYVGGFQNGYANGQGTMTYPNGTTYVGAFKKDRPTGQGTQTYPNGDVYIGEWEDGQQNGQGTMTYADGATYVGEWRNGQRNGRGVATSPNGTVYSGEYVDGFPHGAGQLKFPDGRVQTGTWHRGKPIDPPRPRPPQERRPGGPLMRPPRPSRPFEYWTVRGQPRHESREMWEG